MPKPFGHNPTRISNSRQAQLLTSEDKTMRKTHLLHASALGLIAASGLVSVARAETVIDTSRTDAVQTATVNNGAPDSLRIASGGTLTLTSGTAVTVNSDNDVNLEGKLVLENSGDNATGITVDGARTANLTVSGSITATDNYTATDTNSDSLIDGVFATGTGRYGILATGHLTGNVNVTSASTIAVEGNQSAGIALNDGQTGNFTFDGALTVTGEEVTGIRLAGARTGNAYISGTVTTQGPSASGLDISGAQTGALIIDATIGNSGYRYPTGVTSDLLDSLNAADHLQQGKAAVSISATVTQGILIGGAVTSTDEANTDENGNGLDDSTESTAAITQYGSAPALRIGSDTQDIVIGAVTYNENAIDAYKTQTFGLVNRGSITANGVYSGAQATALQTGGLGHTVTLENGIHSSGTLTATALDADARAAALLEGTRADKFINTGTVSAAVTSADGTQTAYGIYLGTGAVVPAIENSGTISVQANGTDANATAIHDASNSLTSLTNTRFISAAIVAATDETATNRPIAIDTRGNTAGLTLTQTDTSNGDTTLIPYIVGDVWLGSGDDVVNINGGYLLGKLDFGAGNNSLTIDNDGRVGGVLSSAGTIAVDVVNGRLELGLGTQASLSQLHVGENGVIRFNLQSALPTQPVLSSTGTAVFDNGAKVELGFDKLVQTETRYTLLTASSVSLGTIDLDNFDQTLPFVYKATLATDAGNTALYADVRLRTQAESGLSVSEYGAFNAVLSAVQNHTGASAALLAPTTESGFLKAYLAFLPDFSGENLLTLAKGNESLSRTLFAQSARPSAGDIHYWVQEYAYEITRERGDSAGFEARGFSFAGGVERGLSSTQAAGLFIGYTASSPTDSYASPEEDLSTTDLSLGLYWRVDNGAGFKGWVRGGVGRASFESERHILETNFIASNKSKWNGLSYNGSAGASYEFDAGFVTLTPSVSADYYGLKEDAHAEAGGGEAFDLSVEERKHHLFSGTALLNIGRADKDALFRPEVWVGYRNNFSAKIDDTVAKFTGGDTFTLTGGDIEGGGPVAGLRVAASNQYSYFGIEAEYEKQDAYENVSVAIRARFQF